MMQNLARRLKERRLVQWAVAYLGGAWLVLQVASLVGAHFAWPPVLLRALTVLLAVGFLAALVIAWYHGEKGRQRVSGPELVMLAGILVIAGAAVMLVRGGAQGPSATSLAAATELAAPLPGLAPVERSIAVLPFTNLSADPENEYFSDGVTEDILAHLSRIGDLRVISRTSVMQYRGATQNVREIASELGVAHVLEGSVRRDGSRVRIVAQLIDARTDQHLWAEMYDRDLTDIFAIQSEVALEIAAALRANLTARERERLAKRPTDNLAAYDLYLRGLELYARGREQNETAIELFKQAVRLDSDFAAAYAMLGSAYMQRVQTYGFPREWLDSGIVAARHALSIDPGLAAGWRALSSNLSQGGKLNEARDALLRAIELDPNDGGVMVGLSGSALLLGRFDEGMRWARRALPLLPTSPYPSVHLAIHHWNLGNDTEAERWLGRAAEIDPDLPWIDFSSVFLDLSRGNTPIALARARRRVESAPDDAVALILAGDAALLTGNYQEAVVHLERLVALNPNARYGSWQHSATGRLAFALLRGGQPERAAELSQIALEHAQREVEQGNENPGLPFEIGMIHVARGETAVGYEWLERAYAAGWRYYRLTLLYPMLESIRGEERFERLLAGMEADLAVQRARVEGLGR